jgi:putative endonuclease
MSVQRGQEGERSAHAFLVSLGYTIVETNWRFKRAEIDLIAIDGDEIVFVEVKRRANSAYGHPEEYVGHAKARHLRRAIEGYLAFHAIGKMARLQPRVDIIAITDHPHSVYHLKAIELP